MRPLRRQDYFADWLHVLLTPVSPAGMAEAPKTAPPAPPAAPSQSRTPLNAAPTDLGPGYVVERQIGTGSFATVWLATKDNAQCAVKAVDRSRLTKKLRANLDDEIRILGSVKHPNLVAFVDAVPRTERIYVVLEYLSGGDLQKFIRSKGRLHEGTAQTWIGHLAAGLECLWRRSLVHRDLKPQNLLLTEATDDGVLKIGDFGFARQLGPSKLAETLCGSPLYMAPEILALKRYDAKADLWSAVRGSELRMDLNLIRWRRWRPHVASTPSTRPHESLRVDAVFMIA